MVNRETILAQTIIKTLALGSRGTALDVGTGAGYLPRAFASELPGWKITGHDLNNSKESSILAAGAAEFYSGSLDEIPGKFDLITFNHVLEHLTEPLVVLRQATNLLKPDGHLVAVVPSFRYVHTDFFFMEHCSHFTPRSLNIAASLSGLDIVKRMDGVVSQTEIGFIGKRAEGTFSAEALRWAKSLPEFIRSHRNGRRFGVFGVNGAGMWLGAVLKGELSFFVDDDPSKQGTSFAECPIIGVNELSENDVVFVTFNNQRASSEIHAKLKDRRPDVTFVVPS